MDRRKKAVALIHDYKATFGSDHGKRVLADLMRASGFMARNHVPGDPYGTAFNEGGRSLVITILKRLKMDVKQLEKQISEDYDEID